jgi:hypothetical protein
MQLLIINYNNIAFIERKLRFFCNDTRIMSIIMKDYSLTSIVQIAKPRQGFSLAGFVFIGRKLF